MYLSFFLSFITTVVSIILFTKLSIYINLLDKTDERKIHSGTIPLVGGIAIYLSIIFYAIFFDINKFTLFLLIASSLILLAGVFDDLRNISPITRLFLQIVATLFIISNDFSVTSLGSYHGYVLHLSSFGYIFTLFSILVLVNATNFIDGIDGLCASLTLVSIISLLIFSNIEVNNNISQLLFFICFSILIFLFFNLGFIKKYKIFLGDSGSTFLGFLLAWILIYFAEEKYIHPSLLIWCITIPIFDLLRVIIIRFFLKKNPLYPDRIHAHHILFKITKNDKLTLIILTLLAILFSFLGFYVYNIFGPIISLIFYIILFIIYYFFFNRITNYS
jgi:UDP-GlcNAc:undecaprenyl-phosphate GlcNAc-1-phosphate transferase